MAESQGFADVQVPDSFEIFYRQEFTSVVALAYGLCGSRHAAEDLAQDAFLRVHRDWSRVQNMASPGGWVRRIVINLARSRFRRLRSEATARLRLGRPPITMMQPSSESDEFWREVRKLPSRQAEVIALHYVDDLSIAAIADLLGIAQGSVKASLHQGRERLKRLLQAKGLLNET
jgi:RNA polymerase sigma-70 factor (ECF subfamily)